MKRKEHYKNNYNEYWKNRGFDFYTELQIHQYLCGFKLRKKPEKCFVRKQEWIDDVKESHESKDILTLRDLKDFLGLQKCNTESDNIIMANLVLPIFAVLVTSFLISKFLEIMEFLHTLKDSFCILAIITGLSALIVFFCSLKYFVSRSVALVYEYKHKSLFIDDYIEILNELIREKEIEEKE